MKYNPKQYADIYHSPLGRQLWEFLTKDENQVRMETATYLARPAVEPLSPGLLAAFGETVLEARTKQLIGHMVRQIMENRGYRVERSGMKITRANIFASGTRFTAMSIDKELSEMNDRQFLKYGRYQIIAGMLNDTPTAVAYNAKTKAKVLESGGADVTQAIESTKAALDTREKNRAKKRRAPHIGTVDEYVEAFEQVSMNAQQRSMIVAHARANGQRMTATELANAAGYDKWTVANAIYGRLGADIGENIGLTPKDSSARPGEKTYTCFLADGEGKDDEHWVWILHPEVLQALHKLNIA